LSSGPSPYATNAGNHSIKGKPSEIPDSTRSERRSDFVRDPGRISPARRRRQGRCPQLRK